jgi:hypothetical protein
LLWKGWRPLKLVLCVFRKRKKNINTRYIIMVFENWPFVLIADVFFKITYVLAKFQQFCPDKQTRQYLIILN